MKTKFLVEKSPCSLPDDILWVKLLLLEDEEIGQTRPVAQYLECCATAGQRWAFLTWYQERYIPVRKLLHQQERNLYDRWKIRFSQHLKNHWSEE